MQELEEMAKGLLATARKLPPGEIRYGILKEIGKFRARLIALQSEAERLQNIKRTDADFETRPFYFIVPLNAMASTTSHPVMTSAATAPAVKLRCPA